MKLDNLLMQARRVRESARLPLRATGESAGYDLFACVDEPVAIPPGEARRFPAGVAVALPQGTAGLIFARSGLGTKHGVVPANAVGVIDADFRGEIVVTLRNQSGESYEVLPGDRIAQLVIVPVVTPEIQEVDSLPGTARGAGGWGSTGR